MNKPFKIAVIGVGNIGSAVVTNLKKGEREVIVANRTSKKAKDLAEKLGSGVVAMEIAEAIQAADIIVFAIPFNAIKESFNTYKTELQGKIIVDPSNPILKSPKGFIKTIEADESAGTILSSILPENAKLAKALGSLQAETLANSAFQQPEKVVLFYATDNTDINPMIEQLILDSGFEPMHIGGIDQSIRIEVFGDLHESGDLGRTVTLHEADHLVHEHVTK